MPDSSLTLSESSLTKKSILPQFDPRYYQLTIQISLLFWAVFYLELSLPLSHVTAAIITGVLTQFGFTRYHNFPTNLLSTVNSTLSILILLHSSTWVWVALASFIAISSKFLIRYKNKHIFNPSNIGIVAVLLFTSSAWAAPGQWGQLCGFYYLLQVWG